jgi:ribosomal protein L13E
VWWFMKQRKQGKLVPITMEKRRIVPARGFSLLELERAGLTLEDAQSFNLPIDRFRLTSIGTNVLQLCELGGRAPSQVTVTPPNK